MKSRLSHTKQIEKHQEIRSPISTISKDKVKKNLIKKTRNKKNNDQIAQDNFNKEVRKKRKKRRLGWQ